MLLVKLKPFAKFDVLEGKTLAIDGSVLLHQLRSRTNNALILTCTPPCIPTDIIESIVLCNKMLLEYNITPKYIFNSCKYPI